MNNLIDDMKAQAERPTPDSDQVLSEEESPKRKQRKQAPRKRHPMPPQLIVAPVW